jgi:hypothetical protein
VAVEKLAHWREFSGGVIFLWCFVLSFPNSDRHRGWF